MKSVKNIIEQIIVENGMEDELIFANINDIWKTRFDTTIQNNVRISKYKNKILYMKTDSPAWRQEITMRADTIIKEFNSYLKENLIKKIIL